MQLSELTIRRAEPFEAEQALAFYHQMIDLMQHRAYKPGWKKDVYPAIHHLQAAAGAGELYLGFVDAQIVAAMIVNSSVNEAYHNISWSVAADPCQITTLHAFGVSPLCAGQGYGRAMVEKAIAIGRQKGHKAVRLDALCSNTPAQRFYEAIGFEKVAVAELFYEDTGWTDFNLYEYLL